MQEGIGIQRLLISNTLACRRWEHAALGEVTHTQFSTILGNLLKNMCSIQT
jgi:hypothetical protein